MVDQETFMLLDVNVSEYKLKVKGVPIVKNLTLYLPLKDKVLLCHIYSLEICPNFIEVKKLVKFFFSF